MSLSTRAREFAQTLVEMKTFEDGAGIPTCLDWLEEQLRAAEFSTESFTGDGGAPLLVARRAATKGGVSSHALVYNHYDVDPPEGAWSHDPFSVTLVGGRLHGLGLGDNKGALAARLASLLTLTPEAPAITWVIQGEEESGSELARAWFQNHAAGVGATLWIEENGWSDPDGTTRVLGAIGRGVDDIEAPSADLEGNLLTSLGSASDRRRLEARLMNKSLVPGGCPFQASLPAGALYLSIGTNDAKTRIHAPDESILEGALEQHARHFAAVLTAHARGRLS